MYLPSLNYQFKPLRVPIALGNRKSVLHVCKSASVLQVSSFVPYFRFHISVISYSICLSPSNLLSMIISGCIHAAANGIILLFLWLSSILLIGEGNGNPFQCSCLEKPRDGGSWWTAVYGVAQSRTRLKRLSSSSSILLYICTISSLSIHLSMDI